MSDQRTLHRFRILSLAAALVGGALLANPSAAAADSDGYTRIVPRDPRPELSAAAISGLCSSIATKNIAGCAALDAAKRFCASPLDMTVRRPATSELDTLVKAPTCPVLLLAAGAPFNASTKAAGLFDLGWQDALIHGLANFLVDRAKAEALTAAAARLQSGVCGDPTGTRMMPLTCALLGASDPYKVPISWDAVNATVQKDLHELPLRALELGVPLRTKDLKDAPELLYAAVDIGERALAEKQEPVPLLVGLQDKYAAAAGHCGNQPMGCGLLGTGIASEVILPGYTKPAAGQPNYVPIAIRVIVDQAIAGGLVPAGAAASSLVADFQKAFPHILAAIDNAVTQGTAAKASKAASDITAYASALTSIPTAITGAFAPSVGLTAHQQTPPTDAIAIWTQLLNAALNKDYVSASVQVILLVRTIEDGDLPPWTQYLPLLAELAQATTSDKVQQIVEQLAAPVGSYRGKRGAGNHMLSVNGYLGAQGGPEWLGGGGIPKAPSFQAGVFAPIGLESSWGFGKSSSLGVLLTVIDLGAVVSFRTSSDTTTHSAGMDTVTVAQSPQIGLSQVFSPGLYLVYGIPCTPLALGVGGSLSPELRSVTFTSNGAEEQASAFRVSAFLAVDVTIFPF